ncbi:cyanophycin synthetase [Alicycliphilus sp. B1]|nr:cyanophycin synthetase [Alicycliphilus sp. B1]
MATFKDIQLLRATYLRGPSVWTYRPILEVWLDLGELEDYPSNKLPGFNERLTRWLPDLVEHTCGVGERGGFIQRLEGGTWMGHVLEHVRHRAAEPLGHAWPSSARRARSPGAACTAWCSAAPRRPWRAWPWTAATGSSWRPSTTSRST